MIQGGRPRGRLPLHPRPLPHEALSSWLGRLARAYGMRTGEFLRAAFGADPAPDGRELDIAPPASLAAAISERTGVPVEQVHAMTLARYTPEPIASLAPSPGLFAAYACRHEWFIQPGHRRAEPPPGVAETWVPWRAKDLLDGLPHGCSACLAGDPVPYVRLHWRLSWMASCPLHRLMLEPMVASSPFYATADDMPAPSGLAALDRITLKAVVAGRTGLPGGGGAGGGVWLRALRALLDEAARPARLFGRNARSDMAAAWERAGGRFASRQGLYGIPFEWLERERRTLLLAVAGAVVRELAGRRVPGEAGTALNACVTQWNTGQLCRT